jgi:hypothetical protein
MRPAEPSSSSYGRVVLLRLLSTLIHVNAVTFGFRPESVCLERTSTSLIGCALRRTRSGILPLHAVRRSRAESRHGIAHDRDHVTATR